MASIGRLLAPVAIRLMMLSLIEIVIVAMDFVSKFVEVPNHWATDALTLPVLRLLRMLL